MLLYTSGLVILANRPADCLLVDGPATCTAVENSCLLWVAGSHGKKIAVIENEFGEVGIDDALVMETKEEIFEMNNGCVCCTG